MTLLDTDAAAVESSAAGILSAVPGAQVRALTGDVTRESDVTGATLMVDAGRSIL